MSVELSNPALHEIAFLVGEWDLTLSNAAFLPGEDEQVVGHVEITPIESGMLLAIRQLGEAGVPPLASWVIGRDGSGAPYTVLYTDNRGVSRVYEMSFVDGKWAIWRDDPEFSQRFNAVVSADSRTVEGGWEKRHSDGGWEHDFDVRYVRR